MTAAQSLSVIRSADATFPAGGQGKGYLVLARLRERWYTKCDGEGPL
jgi:hypothetical protein